MKRSSLIGTAALTVSMVVAVGLLLKRDPAPRKTTAPHEPSRDKEIGRSVSSVPTQPPTGAPLAKPFAEAAPRAPGENRFADANELDEYKKLKQSVFLDKDGTERRKRLLGDGTLLRRLGGLLRRPVGANDLKMIDYQSQAIDLLIAARSGPASAIAGEVMQSVVADARMESEQVPLADRKALAGVKAELLYEWAGQEPAVAAAIPRWLPGPASQKLWANVQKAHADNEQESAAAIKDALGNH